MFQRKIVEIIAARMREDDNPPHPGRGWSPPNRQVNGNRTGARRVDKPAHSAGADDVIASDVEWLRTEWQQARNLQRDSDRPAILVLDEV